MARFESLAPKQELLANWKRRRGDTQGGAVASDIPNRNFGEGLTATKLVISTTQDRRRKPCGLFARKSLGSAIVSEVIDCLKPDRMDEIAIFLREASL